MLGFHKQMDFFFSSRRRHTRCLSDCSSDVCSSDLLRRSRLGTGKADDLASLQLGGLKVTGVPLRYDDSNSEVIGTLAPFVLVGVDDIPSRWTVQRRSEERRVGKSVDLGGVWIFEKK